MWKRKGGKKENQGKRKAMKRREGELSLRYALSLTAGGSRPVRLKRHLSFSLSSIFSSFSSLICLPHRLFFLFFFFCIFLFLQKGGLRRGSSRVSHLLIRPGYHSLYSESHGYIVATSFFAYMIYRLQLYYRAGAPLTNVYIGQTRSPVSLWHGR